MILRIINKMVARMVRTDNRMVKLVIKMVRIVIRRIRWVARMTRIITRIFRMVERIVRIVNEMVKIVTRIVRIITSMVNRHSNCIQETLDNIIRSFLALARHSGYIQDIFRRHPIYIQTLMKHTYFIMKLITYAPCITMHAP